MSGSGSFGATVEEGSAGKTKGERVFVLNEGEEGNEEVHGHVIVARRASMVGDMAIDYWYFSLPWSS